MQSHWLIQTAYVLQNMIRTICFLLQVFHSTTIFLTECYDSQYQKPSEGQQKYPMLLLLPQSDLTEHKKLNNAAESQTEGNI